MNKLYLLFSAILALLIYGHANAQVNAGTDVTIACGTNTTLTATLFFNFLI